MNDHWWGGVYVIVFNKPLLESHSWAWGKQSPYCCLYLITYGDAAGGHTGLITIG